MRKLLLPMCLTLVGCMPGNMADTPSRDFVQKVLSACRLSNLSQPLLSKRLRAPTLI